MRCLNIFVKFKWHKNYASALNIHRHNHTKDIKIRVVQTIATFKIGTIARWRSRLNNKQTWTATFHVRNYSFYFTGNVPANNTIWILGDKLLIDAGGHYERVKKELKERRSDSDITDNRLYMDSNYAVKIVSPGLYDHGNVPLVILDSLVETLNNNAKIPHTIILALNDKKFWNYKDLLAKEMAWILKKFLKEFHKIIDARKYALDASAVNWDQPRLFITRPLPLPANLSSADYPTGFRSNRRKFNRLLDKARDSGRFTIMNLASFTSQNKNQFFKSDGSISEKGYEQFWIELSDAVQKDDEQVRMLLNKLKAKKLAKTMEAEHLLADDDSENEDIVATISGTKGKDKPRKIEIKKKAQARSPVRRSLASAFNQAASGSGEHGRGQSSSPSQTSRPRSRFEHAASPNVHHKPPHKHHHPGFYKPRRRFQEYNPYFHHYPPPGFPPGPRPGYFPYYQG